MCYPPDNIFPNVRHRVVLVVISTMVLIKSAPNSNTAVPLSLICCIIELDQGPVIGIRSSEMYSSKVNDGRLKLAIL